MFDTGTLIEMYRQDKAAYGDDPFAAPFPTFAQWKEAYAEERAPSHAGSSYVDIEVAVEITDAELDGIAIVS